MSLTIMRIAGNPSELGLPVQYNQQGGYLEPLPHFRRRLVQRGKRRGPYAGLLCLWFCIRGPCYVGYEDG